MWPRALWLIDSDKYGRYAEISAGAKRSAKGDVAKW